MNGTTLPMFFPVIGSVKCTQYGYIIQFYENLELAVTMKKD